MALQMAGHAQNGTPTHRWVRPLLVGGVLAAQTAVIALAWWAGVHEFVSTVEVQSAERVTLATEGTAAGVATAIAKSGIGSLEPGSEGWERAQAIVEQLHLPGGARASVVDRDGHVVCHPRLRSTGRGRKLTPRSASIVGTAPLPLLDATVVVTVPPDAATPARRADAEWVALRIALFGVVLLSLTGVGVLALISLHGSRLEAANRTLTEQMTEQGEAVLRTRTGMIYGLAKLADNRDSDTGHHLDRICTFATLLADELRDSFDEIDDAFIEHLGIAASLHDIGKVGVPDRILLKPGALTEDEWRVMRRHTEIGAATLQGIRRRVGADPLLDMSIDIALRHHEKWDGSGYPGGIAGEQIPLSARIVAAADVYDALTSRRVYKPAMTHDRACAMIAQGRGTHFDPRVADAFDAVAEEFRETGISLRPPAVPAARCVA